MTSGSPGVGDRLIMVLGFCHDFDHGKLGVIRLNSNPALFADDLGK
ncbi:MAG: hypothetical protein ACFE0I_21145 [Elainellaceae cyanobacterium]